MSLTIGKAEVRTIMAVLDQDHDNDLETAAKACLAAMEEIFEKRAKFTVVGQLWKDDKGNEIAPGEPEAVKVALGWYSTEGAAASAAQGLAYSASTHQTYRAWVLDVFHGSPAELHAGEREKLKALEEKRKDAMAEKIRESVRKREAAIGVIVEREEAA